MAGGHTSWVAAWPRAVGPGPKPSNLRYTVLWTCYWAHTYCMAQPKGYGPANGIRPQIAVAITLRPSYSIWPVVLGHKAHTTRPKLC